MTTPQSSRPGQPSTDDYWRAVVLLGRDRAAGLAALEVLFARGSAASGIDGVARGWLLTFTVGHGLDRVLDACASAWMPWRGKHFDATVDGGHNVFTRGVAPLMRIGLPSYPTIPESVGSIGAFRFVTSVGPSAMTPDVEVLRIDYRDVAENPAWPVRKVLDELVRIGDGIYLGQALLDFGGRLRRAAWFALEQPQAS